MSDTKFPGPYVNTCKIDDPIMKRIDLDKMDIGARNSGMPKDVKNSMNLEHVGSGATKS